jgi:hypothetical protein
LILTPDAKEAKKIAELTLGDRNNPPEVNMGFVCQQLLRNFETIDALEAQLASEQAASPGIAEAIEKAVTEYFSEAPGLAAEMREVLTRHILPAVQRFEAQCKLEVGAAEEAGILAGAQVALRDATIEASQHNNAAANAIARMKESWILKLVRQEKLGALAAHDVELTKRVLEPLQVAYDLLVSIRKDGYAGDFLPQLDWALDGDKTGDSAIVRTLKDSKP